MWIRTALALTPLLASGCGLISPPDDTPACIPLRPLTADDLTTGGFDPLTDFGFCNVAHAHQYQIYSLQTTPTATPQLEIYDTDWTFPTGTQFESLRSGASVQFGTESGQVCARHRNTCTAPGAYACQPITVVKDNVWSPLRTELTGVAGGAIAVAGGTAWYMMPRFLAAHIVWRFDPEKFTWRRVPQTFPAGKVDSEGRADSESFTGGAAIGHGNFIDYLVLDRAFRFDTTTSTWTELPRTGHGTGNPSTSVVINGRLWILSGELWSWDPATMKATTFGEVGGGSRDPIAFERKGKLVIGGGNRCDFRTPNCWLQGFVSIDLTTGVGTAEPWGASAKPRLYTQALTLSDRVVLTTIDDEAFVLANDSDTLVPIAKNPALGCAPPTPVHGSIYSRGVVLNGVGVVVGGIDDYRTLAAQPSATIYRP